jgi:hypothetical protein
MADLRTCGRRHPDEPEVGETSLRFNESSPILVATSYRR